MPAKLKIHPAATGRKKAHNEALITLMVVRGVLETGPCVDLAYLLLSYV